jgi:two-component system, chemotaxis family, chemotaxis protein CheY
MRAMVIDDSRAMRTILGKMLKEIGFETSEAVNGKAALEALKASGPVDLALVDWNMPEMNGYEFVQALRADHSFDSMRVMMVTTEADMGNVTKALEAGANEYLMKPFTKEAVTEKLSMLGIGAP